MDHPDLFIDEAHYQLHTLHGRIDLLFSIGDMSFEQVWRNRVDTELDGVTVHFISKRDLIENKRQIGRLIDLANAEQLALIPSEPASQPPERHPSQSGTREEGHE